MDIPLSFIGLRSHPKFRVGFLFARQINALGHLDNFDVRSPMSGEIGFHFFFFTYCDNLIETLTRCLRRCVICWGHFDPIGFEKWNKARVLDISYRTVSTNRFRYYFRPKFMCFIRVYLPLPLLYIAYLVIIRTNWSHDTASENTRFTIYIIVNNPLMSVRYLKYLETFIED